jgi:GTP cyclohydrolase I
LAGYILSKGNRAGGEASPRKPRNRVTAFTRRHTEHFVRLGWKFSGTTGPNNRDGRMPKEFPTMRKVDMDAILKSLAKTGPRTILPRSERPTQAEAEKAVETLLRWIGEDVNREGLLDTPARVAKAYTEMFAGYDEDPSDVLGRTFEEVGGYDDMVLVKDITFHSHCEHHMVPIIGKAHVAYLPDGKVLGLSKIARTVEIFARRLQTQENMTAQIAHAIDEALTPRGVAVMIEAEHMCMAMRGIKKQGSTTVTTCFTGQFRNEPSEQVNFMTLLRFHRN